eukprot:6224966-Amphidinium_carterae.1
MIVLLIAHLQNFDACRKPGTAFTAEYKTPGADASTHAKMKKLGALQLAAPSGLCGGKEQGR